MTSPDTNPDIEDTKADVDRYGALAGLAATDGGKKLVETLLADVQVDVENLSSNYATLTEAEMRSIGSRLNVCLKLSRALNRSQEQYELAKEYLKTLTQ
jgi:hypothetical protein